jgi:kynurenine formamidase
MTGDLRSNVTGELGEEPAAPKISRMEDLARRLTNWGRWGSDDELGTLNHLTPDRRAAARAEIVEGTAISLAMSFDRFGPQPWGDRRLNPTLSMLQTGTDVKLGVQEGCVDGWGYADDMVTMSLQAATHWDSLAHAFHRYRMYNGYPCEEVSAAGARRNSITAAKDRVAGRAVLLDVARYEGVDWLEPGYAIGADTLSAVEEREGVRVGPGDVVLVRTGALARARREGTWTGYAYNDEAGLSLDALPWLHAREVAAVATDNWACEVLPNEGPVMLPVHVVAIVYMGLLVGENFDLEALGEHCAADGRHAGMLVAAPIPFAGAVGAPVNPVVLR